MTLKAFFSRVFLAFALFGVLAGASLTKAASIPSHESRELIFMRSNSEMTSPVLRFERPINSMALTFDARVQDILMNRDPLQGGDWESVEVHDDGFGPDALIFFEPTKAIQFKKVDNTAGPTLNARGVATFFDPQQFADESERLVSGPESDLVASLNVISRSQWGADEALRLWNPESSESKNGNGNGNGNEKASSGPCAGVAVDDGSELDFSRTIEKSSSGDYLTWPVQYSRQIKKIIIHHTDSELKDLNGDHRTDSRDYRAMLRSIYYFHAITRGWGDIGYNYIIDPLGNVYEGRFGGEGVVGAHALCNNNGSIGISIIGNYEDRELPQPAMQALTELVASKARTHHIDPKGQSSFRGKMLPNILGHKDVRATACPGTKLYAQLPFIREHADFINRFGSFSTNQTVETLDFNAELVNNLTALTFAPGERKKLSLTFKNTGKQTWDQNSWLHVGLNNRKEVRLISVIEDKHFVAADLNETSVSPGSTGTFDIEVEAGYTPGSYTFELSPVANGRFKISRSAVNLVIGIAEPQLDYEVASSSLPSGVVFQGQKVAASIKLLNKGNAIWRNYGTNQITLGADSPRDHKSVLVKQNPSRLGYLLESEVRPGEIGTFVMALEIPESRKGNLIEHFTPVIENFDWLPNKDLKFQVSIEKPRHIAKVTNLTPVGSLLPGEAKKVELTFENQGDLPWEFDTMNVDLEGQGIKVFKKSMVPLEPVDPKSKTNFDFWIQAPYEGGTHSVSLKSRFRRSVITGGTLRYSYQVPQPELKAEATEQTKSPINLKPGEEREITVKFKNTGNAIWRNDGPNAIYLAPSKPQDRKSELYYDKSWISKFRAAKMKEKVVNPGEVGTFSFKVRPLKKGVFKEDFQLVIEQAGWISGTVRWDFKVAGEGNVTQGRGINELEDAKLNKERASIITRGKKDITVPVTKTTSVKKTSEKPIRVRLGYGATSGRVTANKAFNVVGADGEVLLQVAAGQTVNLLRSNSTIQATFFDRQTRGEVLRIEPQDPDGIIEITSWEHHPDWNKSLNDNRYRGILEVRLVNDQVAYINELPLEDYMKGLAEVSNDAPFEKMKAMAVIARTYARFYMDAANRKFPGLPYDGSDDPDVFQKYLGYGYEQRSPQFVGAVTLTKNEVVTYKDKLVKTPFFSQSDGRTRSAEEVWGWKDTPYLKSVDDPWCKGLEKKGHGVGLSGCGAEAQAKEGKAYDDIIKYYYQGVEVKELK